MSISSKQATRPTYPRTAFESPFLLCLLVFCLTALMVYRWGLKRWTPVPTHPTYAATAHVIPRAEGIEPSDGPKAPPGQGIGSTQNSIPIPFSCTDPCAEQAVRKANAQADRYVQEQRMAWERRLEEPCRIARQTTENARRNYAENSARLEAFRREAAEAEARAASERQPKKEAVPTVIENPEWLKLNARLENLQQEYNRLLVDRTPLHPVVQQIAERLADVKQQLESIPRLISGETPRLAESHAPTEQTAPIQKVAEADRSVLPAIPTKLAEWTTLVEQSRRALVEAEAAEQALLAQRQAGPQFHVEYAKAIEIPPPPDHGRQRLLWTTFFSAALMAFGVGMVSIGSGIEPVLGSAEELQAAANAPVVGVVPLSKSSMNPIAVAARQSRLRNGLVALGFLLIAVCPALAIWGVKGI